MAELRHRFDFALKQVDPPAIADLRQRQHFDRHLTLHPPMHRFENFPHASRTNASDDGVVAQHQFLETAFTQSLSLVAGELPAFGQPIEQSFDRDLFTRRGQVAASGLELEIRQQSRPSQRVRQLFDQQVHQGTSQFKPLNQ